MTVTIARLDSPAAAARAARLFSEVWRTDAPLIHANLVRALDSAGGYCYGAYDDTGEMVAASVAFLGADAESGFLYSHITGVLLALGAALHSEPVHAPLLHPGAARSAPQSPAPTGAGQVTPQ